MQIRRAEFADVPACAKIHVDGWRFTYSGFLPEPFLAALSYDDFETKWKRALDENDPLSPRWVAERNGEVLGFLHACPPGLDVPGFPNQLSAIYTKPGFQRLGLGEGLVNAYKAWLRERGEKAFHLWVGKQNARAHEFYRAQGGRPVAERSDRVFGGMAVPEWAYGWDQL